MSTDTEGLSGHNVLKIIIFENNFRRQWARVCRWTTGELILLDWQHGEPIESQHDTREALLKSHHKALAHQQMAASSFLRETRRIHHERSRWSASERTWSEATDWRTFTSPLTCYLTVEQRDGKEKRQQQAAAGKAEEKREEVEELGLSVLYVYLRKRQLSLEEVKLLPPRLNVVSLCCVFKWC